MNPGPSAAKRADGPALARQQPSAQAGRVAAVCPIRL